MQSHRIRRAPRVTARQLRARRQHRAGVATIATAAAAFCGLIVASGTDSVLAQAIGAGVAAAGMVAALAAQAWGADQ